MVNPGSFVSGATASGEDGRRSGVWRHPCPRHGGALVALRPRQLRPPLRASLLCAHEGWLPWGLLFPGENAPDYWDFLHFALVIGVASQTADIQIADRSLRRLATAPSLISFVFNTVVLALAVNLALTTLGD
jgi:hypothetical protein